jgi:5'-nucleotidase
MRILLTNDDSHSSPLLRFLVAHLRTLGDLTIVVPMEEQSWTGKAMTRFSPLYVDEIALGDARAFCVDGTPADCVNLAVHHLTPAPPDLVVSGINIGRNTGVGFALSSGTVGACLEANIAGIPGIALSQDLETDVYMHWGLHREFRPEVVEQLSAQTMALLPRITNYLLDGKCGEPVTWNVNLPSRPAPDCRLVHTFLGHSFYGSCFQKTGDRYHHNLKTYQPDERPQADGVVIRAGHVSVTRLDMRDLGGL